MTPSSMTRADWWVRSRDTADELAFRSLLAGDADGPAATVTFGELHRRASSLAARLGEIAAPGDRALLLYDDGIELITALLACFRAGVIGVPSFPPDPRRLHGTLPRVLAVIDDSKASVILTTGRVVDAGQALRSTLPSSFEMQWLATDGPEILEAAPADLPPRRHDVAYLQYTSGSTGTPKGVAITHGCLEAACAAMAKRWRYAGRKVQQVSWLPVVHDMGLVWGLFLPLFTGASTTLMSPAAFLQRPARWLEAVTRFKGNTTGAPNFAFELCVRRVDDKTLASLDLSSLTEVANAAEPVRAATIDRFVERFGPVGFDARAVCPCYGLAEATLPVVMKGSVAGPTTMLPLKSSELEQHRVESAPAGSDATVAIGCGPVVEGCAVAVVDHESHRRVGPDEVGEVWVCGPMVAGGYWNRPDESRETFEARIVGEDSGPWLRTGDLGFFHDEELFITGRIKDLIIIRGRNLYPQDVEQTTEVAHPAVRRGCVAAFPVVHESEEVLGIALEVKPERVAAAGPQAVIDAVRHAVAESLEVTPQLVALIPPRSLFKTTSGKVRRRKTRQAIASGKLECLALWDGRARREPVAKGAPRSSDLEKFIWETLEAEYNVRVSRNESAYTPFRDLGLDSVGVVGLSDAIATYIGRPVSPTILYDYPTVASLCAHIAEGSSRRHALRRRSDSPIAVVAAACRLPGGASTVEQLWDLLRRGDNAVSEIPDSRWDQKRYYDPTPKVGHTQSRWAGLLDDLSGFDADFFGMSADEAESTDPQQRLLLELTWEVLERAGIAPGDLADSATGIFVGQTSVDWLERTLASGDPTRASHWTITGTTPSMTAGRVSHRLNLRGPALTIDTACSSSLVALHTAVQSLRQGECDLALAGGVNMMLSPAPSIALSQMGALSPTGRCASFAGDANGYVRAEGCALVALKVLSDAERDGDPILAVVRGSAINHDGRTNGLTAPSGRAQREVIQAALQSAALEPADVHAVECHGTGTPLGDLIEAEALGVYGEGRSAETPLWVGSIKSNIGHAEGAAGVAGFLKAVLSVAHRSLPKTLHATSLNAKVPWQKLGLRVAQEPVELRGDGPLRVGVSSFGFSGTNAHVIIEEAPRDREAPAAADAPTDARYPVVLSGRTLAALEDQGARLLRYLREHPDAAIGDVALTLAVGRDHFRHRAAFVASDVDALTSALEAFESPPPADASATLCFVAGAGSDPAWQSLHQRYPAFEAAVAKLYRAAHAVGLTGSFVPSDALYGLAGAYGLAALLDTLGVAPDQIVEEAGGRALAALLAGSISLEDACRVHVEGATGSLPDRRPPRTPLVVAGEGAVAADALLLPLGAAVRGAAKAGAERWLPSDLVDCLAALHAKGLALRWKPFFVGGERADPSVPTYAFQREPYWLDRPAAVEVATVDAPSARPAHQVEIERCLATGDVAQLRRLVSDRLGAGADVEGVLSVLCRAYQDGPNGASEAGQAAEQDDDEDILPVVREVIAKGLHVDAARISDKAKLEDLGVDSLNALSLGAKLGEVLGLDVPRDFCLRWATVGKLVEELDKLRGRDAKSPAPAAAPTPTTTATAPAVSSPWFSCQRPQADARARLFCFPYSGATSALFRGWHDALPDDVEVHALELPGRSVRSAEQPVYPFADLVGRLAEEVRRWGDRPFAFFGHSFGGYVAFELCRELRRRGAPLPYRLFLSACRAPQLPPGDWVLDAVHSLHGDAFWNELLRLEIIPRAVFDDAQLRELVEPAVRADLELLESWRYRPELPLDVPLTLLTGREDTLGEARFLTAYGHLSPGWRMHSTRAIELVSFGGDHFFVNSEAKQVCAELGARL